ncbi:uncharacterized protein E0L32_003507 [Thyridium curvatum]|uniref:Uncharacterized protein n=1 Tax=Thyridium curvatum TaxID=1093900 RepID=A0A507B1H3_9PEZI|nr:uncharacterized protein E0L32_003507 [Thyridium curvatum]TPX16945.1 hypothetical protein E0L32_003507 [Thyridium curvatum]
MSQDQNPRIANAIDSLITHIIPNDPKDSNEVAQQRHDDRFELVQNLLFSSDSPAIAADVNHAYDLIKKKLLQRSPPKALRFTNLYTLLIALPVLNQKWAILYLLYQLADSPDPNEPLPLSPLRQPFQQRGLPQAAEQARSSKVPTPVSRHEDEAYNDAFSPEGLKKFPPERTTRGAQEAASDEADESPRRDVSLKSTLLANNYSDYNPSETSLLRDLPFTLQGLNSTTMVFYKDKAIKLPPTLPAPIISLLHALAEPSLLHRGLTSFVNSPAKGLLGQSLRAAINGELRSYLSLVATLEAQIRRALSALDESAPRSGIGKAGVTLKRCVVWTREATMGLRLMSVIAEESKSRRGGQLITLIHNFSSSHGDPTVAAFAERLLAHVTRPFYDILRHWIYDGELSDPYLEFFVKQQNPADERRKEAKAKGFSSVWTDKYEVDDGMIPSIVSADFAQKVFLIGKSLNFIRHSCGDSQWVEDYSKAASKELRYGDTATLEAWIDEAYKTTMRRLMHLMTDKFHLFEHLAALKKYILLGQGDFIALLMESLAANLDRPAGAQYRHTLTAQLEHAIRGSNAQYDPPEVLRRLDARMLQLSHGDIGWDCFTLEYKIDAPVDCVVTEWGNRQYLKVFNFLWRIKRVEFALASTWRRCMTGSRGVLHTADRAVLRTWKATRGTLAEMVHFVGQLQYYILFEVIESSWDALQRAVAREDCTLDDLVSAHTQYLRSITHKGLLGAQRRQHREAQAARGGGGSGAAAAAPPAEDHHSYMLQLSELLRTMLAYRDCVDGLYSWAVSDFTRRQESDIIYTQQHRQGQPPNNNNKRHTNNPFASTSKPSTPTPGGDDPFFSTGSSTTPSVESELPALQDRLRALGQAFKARLTHLLGDLGYQQDADLRFLGVSMNFNEFYQLKKKSSSSSPPSGAGGGGAGAGAASSSTTATSSAAAGSAARKAGGAAAAAASSVAGGRESTASKRKAPAAAVE